MKFEDEHGTRIWANLQQSKVELTTTKSTEASLTEVSLQERQLEKSEEAGAGAQTLNGIGRIPNQRNAKQRIPGNDAYNRGTLDSARVNRNHWWNSYASSVIVIKRHGKWIWRSKLSYFGQCHYLRVHRTRQILALHRRAYFGVWSMSARDFSTPSFSHIFNYFVGLMKLW